MRLHPDWKKILKNSWNLRLLAASGVLYLIENLGPYLPAFMTMPPLVGTVILPLLVAAAGLARLVLQTTISGAKDEDAA